MNLYLILILTILVATYLIHLIVEIINLKCFQENLPEEFVGSYDPDKYRKSQKYLKDNTIVTLVESSLTTPLLITFLVLGGFNRIDQFARCFGLGSITTGLIFTGIILFASQIIQLPFSVFDTFVIEEKYGFNKTTIRTFIIDLIKGWALGAIVGSIILTGIFWFLESSGSHGWLYAWVAVSLFQLILMFIAPTIIMPLFNKFTPLPDGELKREVEEYAAAQNFKMKGVFTMDGSRRSTKSNAYFTGFGKFRRIVLFDTLIENHKVHELVAILAHEMGHYKKHHIHKFIAISIASTGLMFYILSLFINNPGLFGAFRMETLSIYASVVFFGFLYSPISMMLSVVTNYLSRKFEFEADAYAAATYRKPTAMVDALKKLSVDNLSNLHPHPLKVILEYSHPPVLARIQALENVHDPSSVR